MALIAPDCVIGRGGAPIGGLAPIGVGCVIGRGGGAFAPICGPVFPGPVFWGRAGMSIGPVVLGRGMRLS